ncbi:hypothetical protein FBULB1_12143 [Fusarium bulbicola]|nr:hypothetical protein FBULB1_12143 [Fusarium bulbicola]
MPDRKWGPILIVRLEKLTLLRSLILPMGCLVFTATGELRATMAIQELVTGKAKHKRASAPKSRKGCITWIRHLKCDEAKPTCNRCCEDKIKCDGYAMPRPKAPRRKHRKKVTPSIIDTLSLCLTIDDVPSLSPPERLYFQHFLQFTTTQLSLSSGSTNLWLRYALPIGYQFESIQYSMIAVGASHRLFMAKSLGHSDQDGLKSFATHQYNKAIATIVPSITASQDLQIIMICCLLFISFEGLTGRYDELFQHLSAGISLFNSPLSSSNDEDRGMTAKLAEMFCRLGVESSNFVQNDPSFSGNRREGLLDSRDFVELHELARALETCKEPKFDANWKPTAAAGIPTIIERLRESLG